jgi:hypothetical protein
MGYISHKKPLPYNRGRGVKILFTKSSLSFLGRLEFTNYAYAPAVFGKDQLLSF